MMTAAIFAVLIGLIMLGLPIAVSMGLTAVVFFILLGQADMLMMLPARMYSSTTGFPLLAIPFFILVGLLMNTGGMTQRIFRLAQCMVGHIKGGLGHVNVVNSMIFSGISGSAIADAAGIGMVELEAMVNAGFDRRFSAAVTAASSTIGPIIPPSIPFVIFGSMTGTSVGRLFLGGFIPGILMGVFMMVAIYIISRQRGYPREKRATLRELLRSILDSWSATLCPVVIIGGIMVGIFTPTEAAIVSVAYALVVTVWLYREITWKDLPKILWETLQHTIRVMFIISAAGIFGWLLVHQKVPEAIITGLMTLSSSPWVILLIINIILLVLGCFMEITSIMLLTIPIFMPLITKVGIDPVHFGNVMTLNLMIGLLAPPAGLVLCTVASIAKVPIWELAYECRWYMVAILATLALITYIPSLVTWVPDMVMGPGR
jgi:C4-dicarboxylate transporter, DctM subunit